ncbi:MAG: acyl carrier protein [Magnetococcales bacterium]|nr:acyl carrier protein [Magnetococcales bacterium]|tara:strand:+ start:78739 stop:78990 length:252 start_codon:yes stop_codon:yes gene_type:complete
MSEPTHAEIVAKIIEELKSLNEDFAKVELSGETNMTTDIQVDSLDVMELVFSLEEAYDASIPVNELSNVYTINELAALVQKSR